MITFLEFLLSIFFVGFLKKSFCVREKVQKIIDPFLDIILFEKPFFLIVLPLFAIKMFFHAWSSKTFCHLLVFSNFFEKYLCLSLCFFFFHFCLCFQKKISHLKSKWFSLLCPFTSSSWFVRSLCVFSLCLLFLVATLLVENFREKNLVSYCSPSQIFPRKIFLFLVPFSSIEEKLFCEQLLLFIVLSFFGEKNFLKKIFRIFLKKILFSSLFVFVHHASHSPLFFISVFA